MQHKASYYNSLHFKSVLRIRQHVNAVLNELKVFVRVLTYIKGNVCVEERTACLCRHAGGTGTSNEAQKICLIYCN